jgi:hypothetical protein
MGPGTHSLASMHLKCNPLVPTQDLKKNRKPFHLLAESEAQRRVRPKGMPLNQMRREETPAVRKCCGKLVGVEPVGGLDDLEVWLSLRGFIDGVAVRVSLYDPHMPLVESKHLRPVSTLCCNPAVAVLTYPLRTPLVNDARRMLGLVAILPREVHHELAGLFILASVQMCDMFLPAPRRRLPRHRFCAHRRLGIRGMVAVSP